MENCICEHAVKQKLEGKWVWRRIGLVTLYVLLLLVAAFLGLLFKNILPFVVVAALVDVGIWALTWRRTKLEYEYAMTGGILVFSNIYGGSARKVIFEKSLKEIDAAFPYGSEKGTKKLNDYAPEVQYYALSTENAEENTEKEIWCCLFENDEGKRSAFYFELTDGAYRYLRSYAGTVTAARIKNT